MRGVTQCSTGLIRLWTVWEQRMWVGEVFSLSFVLFHLLRNAKLAQSRKGKLREKEHKSSKSMSFLLVSKISLCYQAIQIIALQLRDNLSPLKGFSSNRHCLLLSSTHLWYWILSRSKHDTKYVLIYSLAGTVKEKLDCAQHIDRYSRWWQVTRRQRKRIFRGIANS